MAHVRIPPDSTGARVDVRAIKESGVDVVRERVELATSSPVVTRVFQNVLASETFAFDSAQITAGRVGRLLGVDICGLAPWEADIQTVLNGVATSRVSLASGLAVPC